VTDPGKGIAGWTPPPFRFGGLGTAPTVAHSDVFGASLPGALAGPGVATTAARSDAFTAAGGLLLGQTYAKELWVPAKDFESGLGGPSYAINGSWAAFAYAWQLRHGFQDGIGAFINLPADYSAGSTIIADVYYQGGGAGNFRIDGQGLGIATGTPGGTAFSTGSATGSATVVSYNGLALASGLFTIAATTSGALLNVVVDRNGTDAADTSTNVMYLFGVRLRYTAVRV
jgi:hypothetical protein